ncbi:hypothetical protein [Qingrenia yutianensis]|uniref:Dockerin domain-containing protein n=1 Tax=Qingrenia yutianensis TaxID=2763676 RepID=A0A926FD97_9FIRM|nr:hypothetical protein [Qingrenia yutianensis]MBC8597107.1 hypothetical protein [Qingrenia yutianensis]
MKTFNKVISLVTVIVFVFSMMAVPAFATGREGFPTVTGNENLTVTYYSDSALTNEIKNAEPNSVVYAKVTANVPSGTFASLDVNLAVENATIDEDISSFSIAGLARDTSVGNTINSARNGANIYIGLDSEGGGSYNSPTNYEELSVDPSYMDLAGSTSFAVTTYKLTVGASGTVKFTNSGESAGMGCGIDIGGIDFDFETGEGSGDPIVEQVTVVDTGLAIGGSTPAEKQVSFKATFDETKEYSHKLSAADLEDAIAKDITVVKTVDGTQGTDNIIADLKVDFDHENHKFTINFANGVGEGEVLATGAAATATFTYKLTEAVVDYTYDHVEFNGAKVEGGRVETAYDAKYLDDTTLKNAFVVYGKKTVDGVATEEVVAVPADKGHVNIGRSATSNEVSIFVYFKGANIESITLGFTDVPVDYSNVKAELTTTEFANNTDAATVKAAVKVTATKTQGVIKTDNITLTLGTDYDVEIYGNPANVTENGYVTVTLKGEFAEKELTPLDGKLIFGVTPDTIEYKDYVIEFEGGNTTFLATATDEDIKGKMTVKADKYVNSSKIGTEEVAPANFESVVIERSTGLVTVTLKAGEPYKGETVTATITLKDVIEYRNVRATMSTRMFPAGATDETIKGALTIVADKYVNNVLDGAEQSALPADEYTVAIDTVDANNKTVKITYSEKCISVADAYKEFAVAVGISANAKITLSPAGTVNKGEDFNAAISVEGLGTNKVYAAVIKISANTGTGTGTLVSFTPAAGYDKHSEDMENGTVTVIRNAGGTAADVLGTFTIKAAADKDAEIVVKVETLKLTTVEGDDIANLPSFTGDEERIIVTEVVVPTTAKINASFDIKTLGDVTSAKDKFKAGLKVTKGTDVVTVPAENIVVTEKKVELKDLEVEAGVYKVSVDVPGYTKAEVEIKVIYDSETNTMNVTSSATGREAIYAGDVDGNGSINAKDYADLVAKIGQAAAENVNCDLYTKDGEANISVNDIITMVYEFETYFGATITSAGLIVE